VAVLLGPQGFPAMGSQSGAFFTPAFFFWACGSYCIAKARAELASAALRLSSHWQPRSTALSPAIIHKPRELKKPRATRHATHTCLQDKRETRDTRH
jgi:hypothetical protein